MDDGLIKPHGSDTLNPLYVADERRRAELLQEAESLPSIIVSSAAASNAVMLASGYFNPLTGFMGLAESLKIAEGMQTKDGLFWPVPITNVVKDAGPVRTAGRIALRDPNVEGNPVIAIQDVEAIEDIAEDQMTTMVKNVFGTLDGEHPGVATWMGSGRTMISGPIHVLNYSYFDREFPGTFRTAVQLRETLTRNGWRTVVAFQTRNPMHRAHEELVRLAMNEL